MYNFFLETAVINGNVTCLLRSQQGVILAIGDAESVTGKYVELVSKIGKEDKNVKQD